MYFVVYEKIVLLGVGFFLGLLGLVVGLESRGVVVVLLVIGDLLSGGILILGV